MQKSQDLLPYLLDRRSEEGTTTIDDPVIHTTMNYISSLMSEVESLDRSVTGGLQGSSTNTDKLRGTISNVQQWLAQRLNGVAAYGPYLPYFTTVTQRAIVRFQQIERRIATQAREDADRQAVLESGTGSGSWFGVSADDFSRDPDEDVLAADTVQVEDDLSGQMNSIEGKLREVGDLMAQFSGMVAIQGEQINLMDDNVNQSTMYVDMAETNINKTLTMVQKNRWLVMKLIVVFFVFGLILFAGKFTGFL